MIERLVIQDFWFLPNEMLNFCISIDIISIVITSTSRIRRRNVELIYTETFGKQYCMEHSEYEVLSDVSFPFSVRVQNRFERCGIITVSDLLRKTPDDLMGLAGFGRGCLVDIDNILTSYVKDKTITAPSLSKQESTRTALVGLKEGMAEYTTSLAENQELFLKKYKKIQKTS